MCPQSHLLLVPQALVAKRDKRLWGGEWAPLILKLCRRKGLSKDTHSIVIELVELETHEKASKFE